MPLNHSEYGKLPLPPKEAIMGNLSDIHSNPDFIKEGIKEGIKEAIKANTGLTNTKDIDAVYTAFKDIKAEAMDGVLDLVKTEAKRTGRLAKFVLGELDQNKLDAIAKGTHPDGLLEKPVAKMTKAEKLQQTAHIAANYPEVYTKALAEKQDVCKMVEIFSSRQELSLKDKLVAMNTAITNPKTDIPQTKPVYGPQVNTATTSHVQKVSDQRQQYQSTQVSR